MPASPNSTRTPDPAPREAVRPIVIRRSQGSALSTALLRKLGSLEPTYALFRRDAETVRRTMEKAAPATDSGGTVR